MKKFLKVFLIIIVFFVLITVLVLGYLGFVPGVSAMFGSNKPRDLGVRFTSADLQNAQAKLNQAIVANQNVEVSQGIPVEAVLTQEEYSAHAQAIHPVNDLQIKLEGSNFQISGRIDKSRIPGFLRTWGLTDVSDAEIINAVNQYLPGDPVFYVAGSGGATNNDLEVDISKAEFGRLPVSNETAEEVIEAYTETLFREIPGFSVESSRVENGRLKFSGTSVKELPKY